MFDNFRSPYDLGAALAATLADLEAAVAGLRPSPKLAEAKARLSAARDELARLSAEHRRLMAENGKVESARIRSPSFDREIHAAGAAVGRQEAEVRAAQAQLNRRRDEYAIVVAAAVARHQAVAAVAIAAAARIIQAAERAAAIEHRKLPPVAIEATPGELAVLQHALGSAQTKIETKKEADFSRAARAFARQARAPASPDTSDSLTFTRPADPVMQEMMVRARASVSAMKRRGG